MQFKYFDYLLIFMIMLIDLFLNLAKEQFNAYLKSDLFSQVNS